MEIKNLKKAAERIKKAIKKNERIILYGDSDMDGVTSVLITKESIMSLGGKVSQVYFPDRENEGYGLSPKALEFLKKEAPAVLILFDCGISNFKEIKLARKMGFFVIVVDHHEILGKVPLANIVVDPKQKGDTYPFKLFSTGGLAFKLAEALFEENFSPALKESFYELAALSTISDMMPQKEDNEVIVEKGLYYLERTIRPGIKTFFEKEDSLKYVPIREAVQKILSIMGSAETKNHINTSFLLLTAGDGEEAEKLKKYLSERSLQKQATVREMTEYVGKIAVTKSRERIIFEGKNEWAVALLGAAASRVCNEFQKPTFLFKKKKDLCMGAVRNPSDVSGVKAMEHCSKLLKAFGGHPMASGFTVETKNLEKFKGCLVEYFEKQ